MQNEDGIWVIVDGKAPTFAELSDRVWETPELGFQETRSAAAHMALLEAEGFRIETDVAGLPTAFMGEAGTEGPIIAILGEFDALPGLSQKAGLVRHDPLQTGGNGHGCGHNLLGAASLLAASSVKDWLAASGMKGRVRYYACPAEESGSGKSFMVRAGAFDEVDIAICWHPAAFTGVNPPRSLACLELEFHFAGRSAHAAATPHLGRSALDAVELMHVGINYMREHMPSTARIHYAITDSGGIAPNVVQSRAVSRLMIRAASLREMWALHGRVKKVAEGAALMTETEMSEKMLAGEANLVGNETLERTMDQAIQRLGPPPFDEADKEFAAQIQTTFNRDDIMTSYARFGLKPKPGEALSEEVFRLGRHAQDGFGSTDVGSVSWVVPTVQCRVACYAIGTPGHSWQLVAQGQAPAAHKGLAHAAKIMAATSVDLLKNEGLLRDAKTEHAAFRAENEFINPIGTDLQADLDMANA